MSDAAIVDREGLLVAARPLAEIKVGWLQTYILVQTLHSYAKAADILGIHSKVVRERIDSIEEVYGHVLFNDKLKQSQPLDVPAIVAKFQEAVALIDAAAGGRLQSGSNVEKRAIGNITVGDMRTLILLSTKAKRHEICSQLNMKEYTLSRTIDRIGKAFGVQSILVGRGNVYLSSEGRELIEAFCSFIEIVCNVAPAIKIEHHRPGSIQYKDALVGASQNSTILHFEAIKPIMRKKVVQLRRAKISAAEKRANIRRIAAYYANIKRSERRLFIIFYVFRYDLLNGHNRAVDMAFARMRVLWKAENIKVSGNRLTISPL